MDKNKPKKAPCRFSLRIKNRMGKANEQCNIKCQANDKSKKIKKVTRQTNKTNVNKRKNTKSIGKCPEISMSSKKMKSNSHELKNKAETSVTGILNNKRKRENKDEIKTKRQKGLKQRTLGPQIVNPVPLATSFSRKEKKKFKIRKIKNHRKKTTIKLGIRKKSYKEEIIPVAWKYLNLKLFPEWKCFKSSWKLLEPSECEFLTPLLNKSINFKIRNTSNFNQDTNWKNLKSFLGCAVNDKKNSENTGDCCLYAGTSVQCIAWCPVSSEEETNQFVALSTDIENGDDTQSTGLIQIWNINISTCKPEWKFAIVHDYKEISTMLWCPIGAYEEPVLADNAEDDLPRLGLLALACNDGNIRIHSIPHPQFLHEESLQISLYVKKPDVVLTPISEDLNLISCTAADWLKSESCDKIAAGYSDGLIRLFDLTCGIAVIHAIHTFQAHRTIVTCITFAPFPQGRWIVSGSMDSAIKFWDTTDVTAPSIINNCGTPTKLHWFPKSTNVIASFQRPEGHWSVRFIMQWLPKESFQVLQQQCAANRGSDLSEKFKFLALGNLNGELNFIPLHTDRDCHKPIPIHIYHTKMEEIESSTLQSKDDVRNHFNKHIKCTEKNAKVEKKLGLVFEDVNIQCKKYFKEKLKMLFVSNPSEMKLFDYNDSSITNVSWNPNKGCVSYLFVAGYSGLCRIINFPNLENW